MQGMSICPNWQDFIMSLKLPKIELFNINTAVVIHDAGAANLLIGWFSALNKLSNKKITNKFFVVAFGPARALWERQFPGTVYYELEEAISKSEQIISGTGWQSDLEHNSRVFANKTGKHNIAVIDHWVNYEERFKRNGYQSLPAEIWVSDSHASKIAREKFPRLNVKEFDNLYLVNQVDEVLSYSKMKSTSNSLRILYALEPIRYKWSTLDLRKGEIQALDYFLENLKKIALNRPNEIRIRPHPSDEKDKYTNLINSRTGYNLKIDNHHSLSEAIAWSDIVVGCETFALIIGVHSSRRVISSLPPWGHQLRLPYKEIEMLSAICNHSLQK